MIRVILTWVNYNISVNPILSLYLLKINLDFLVCLPKGKELSYHMERFVLIDSRNKYIVKSSYVPSNSLYWLMAVVSIYCTFLKSSIKWILLTGVVGWIMASLQWPHPNLWNLWIHFVTWQGRIQVADGINVARQLTWRWGELPGFSRWTQCNHKHPCE